MWQINLGHLSTNCTLYSRQTRKMQIQNYKCIHITEAKYSNKYTEWVMYITGLFSWDLFGNQNSTSNVVARLLPGRLRSHGRCQRFFYSLNYPGQQPVTKWVMGVIFPVVKPPVCEPDHLAPSTAQLSNMWIFTFTSPYAFVACITTTLFTLLWYTFFNKELE